MAKFSGFSPGKQHLTPLPGSFFSELLPEIDHLGELKVTLFAFWFLDRQEGDLRYFTLEDLTADELLLKSFAAEHDRAVDAVKDALERAVQRGTLLSVRSSQDTAAEGLYFLNSPRGRAAVEALQAGAWSPQEVRHPELSLDLERPNIFRLYEQNIGPLTPLIAETLREAEQTYPIEWIEDAIRAALASNVRRWRYVEAILRSRLEREQDEATQGKSEKDRRRYVQGEYGDYVEH